jgi:hypothetical protein
MSQILEWFRDGMEAYNLKELEAKIPKAIAGVNGMQVKEYLQALADENLIKVEKIGSGNWYWSFRSDAKKIREATIYSLKAEEDRMIAAIADSERQIEEEMEKRHMDDEMVDNGGMDRKALMEAHEALMKEKECLDNELALYSDNNPTDVLKKMEESAKLKRSAMRWTDNLESLESYLMKSLSVDRGQVYQLMKYVSHRLSLYY